MNKINDLGDNKELFLSHLIKNFSKDMQPSNISARMECSSVTIYLTRILDLKGGSP